MKITKNFFSFFSHFLNNQRSNVDKINKSFNNFYFVSLQVFETQNQRLKSINQSIMCFYLLFLVFFFSKTKLNNNKLTLLVLSRF